MRKKDDERIGGKVLKTINFDKYVLDALERRAKDSHTTVSNLVNSVVRSIVLTDKDFYALMAKHHYLQFQNFQYMCSQIELQIINKAGDIQ
jgi:hypothetical protein